MTSYIIAEHFLDKPLHEGPDPLK